jgi:ribosomal-protein-alanine N-acetyltransferase
MTRNPSQPFPYLETSRLELREITPSYAAAILQLFGDEAVVRYMDIAALATLDEAQEIIDWAGTLFAHGRGVRWGIVRKGDSTLIGTCGYHNWDHSSRRAEVGYDLAPAQWGKGLMHEALEAVLTYGFEKMGLNRVQAMVHPENARSIHLLQRLGFTREGVLREWRFYKGQFWDETCFSLLRHEWATRSGDAITQKRSEPCNGKN